MAEMMNSASITEEVRLRLVRDYMTRNPATLDSSQSLLEASLFLKATGFRHIPVMEGGRLAGLLSDRDVARLTPSMLVPHSAAQHNELLEQTVISKVMIRNPVVTAPETTLAEAVEILSIRRLGCLLVVDGGQLAGIITVQDMLRALRDLISRPQPQ